MLIAGLIGLSGALTISGVGVGPTIHRKGTHQSILHLQAVLLIEGVFGGISPMSRWFVRFPKPQDSPQGLQPPGWPARRRAQRETPEASPGVA